VNIAVISDTHIGDRTQDVPEPLWDMVAHADACFHLGDFTDEAFARQLRRANRLFAVSGNADPYSIRSMFPAVRVVELEGVRFALMHRFAGPWAAAQLRAANYRATGVSVICFGHTHNPENTSIAGVRLLNPGSAGDGRRTRGRFTAGMLQVENGRFKWELWPLGREVFV